MGALDRRMWWSDFVPRRLPGGERLDVQGNRHTWQLTTGGSSVPGQQLFTSLPIYAAFLCFMPFFPVQKAERFEKNMLLQTGMALSARTCISLLLTLVVITVRPSVPHGGCFAMLCPIPFCNTFGLFCSAPLALPTVSAT